MSNSRTCVVALLVGLNLCFPQVARAETAAVLLVRARKQFNIADFSGSLKLLRAARRSATKPKVVGQIYLYLGLNHAVLNDRVQAARDFHRALVADPALTLDPTRFKGELRLLFATTREGMRGGLTVRARHPRARTFAGARVFVDGKAQGRLPLHTQLSVGDHLVEVRSRAGHFVRGQRVVVPFDKEVTVQVESQDRLGLTTPMGSSPVGASELRTRRGAPRPIYKKWWFWTLIGAAAVAVVVPVVLTTGGDDWVPNGRDGRFDPSSGVP